MTRSHRIVMELAVALAWVSSAPAQPLPDPTVSQTLATFAQANTIYARQEYARAAELYEAILAADSANASGVSGQAYFYLANSYDNFGTSTARQIRRTNYRSRMRPRITSTL